VCAGVVVLAVMAWLALQAEPSSGAQDRVLHVLLTGRISGVLEPCG
jgi:hypothetical protein